MNTAVFMVSCWAYYFFRVVFCFKYMDLLFTRKSKTRAAPYICAVLAASLNTLNVSMMQWIFSRGMLIIVVIINILFSCFCFRGKKLIKADVTFFYHMIVQFIDLFITTVLYMILGKAIVSKSIERSLFFAAGIFIWILLYILLRKPLSEYKDNVSTRWIRVFNIISFIAIIYFQRIYLAVMSEGMMIYWLIFMIFAAFIICLQAWYMFRLENLKKLAIAELKNEMIGKNYNRLQSLYKENRKLFHDLRKHLGSVRFYLQENRIQDGIDYINEIYSPLEKVDEFVNTGNNLIDAIINYKMTEAAEYGLKSDIEADKLGKLNISDSDICVIFANLLDNAIENCAKDGTIVLKLTMKNHFLIFKVINPIKDPNDRDAMTLRKESKLLHGIGLESVKISVERNQGAFEYTNDGETFESFIMLPTETDTEEVNEK
jgi:hypothetical protein